MIQKRIREEAKKLLENKEVDVIVGFGEGTLPLRTMPVFIRNPEEVDRLVWNSFCENNLAAYLHKLEKFKVGLVVKGCDARAVVALSLEKRFRNNPVYLVGVPCQRMIDRRKVRKAVKKEILRAVEDGDRLVMILGRSPHPSPGDAHGAEAEPVNPKIAAQLEDAAGGRRDDVLVHSRPPFAGCQTANPADSRR